MRKVDRFHLREQTARDTETCGAVIVTRQSDRQLSDGLYGDAV